MFRLAVTADLHHDVARSRAAAEDLAARYNADDSLHGILLAGDTATADGDKLETALALFRDDKPRLFLPGNHELWARHPRRDVRDLLRTELPGRLRAAGWHWLHDAPFLTPDAAVVGVMGWYDYAFAADPVGIPRASTPPKPPPAPPPFPAASIYAPGTTTCPRPSDASSHAGTTAASFPA